MTQVLLEKQEESRIHNPTYHLKASEEQTKPKVSKRKEVIKIREERKKTVIKAKVTRIVETVISQINYLIFILLKNKVE